MEAVVEFEEDAYQALLDLNSYISKDLKDELEVYFANRCFRI